MKFSGLIHEGCAWPPDQPIGLTFETVKELQQHHTNYIQNGQLVCRTHRDARPGQQITIQIELPNRDRFTVKGVIEKVKDQAGKPYTLSLLRLGPLGRTQRRQIADSLTYQDDVASHPSRSETPTDTPSPPLSVSGELFYAGC